MNIYRRQQVDNQSGNKEQPLLLTYRDAAALLQISERKLRNMVNAGLIPHIRVVNSVRFSRAGLEKWIQDNTVGGDGAPANQKSAVNDTAA